MNLMEVKIENSLSGNITTDLSKKTIMKKLNVTRIECYSGW